MKIYFSIGFEQWQVLCYTYYPYEKQIYQTSFIKTILYVPLSKNGFPKPIFHI